MAMGLSQGSERHIQLPSARQSTENTGVPALDDRCCLPLGEEGSFIRSMTLSES